MGLRGSGVATIRDVSARHVAAGGERGWWRWLVPALVVAVVASAAFHVHQLNERSDRAAEVASSAARVEVAAGRARTAASGDRAERDVAVRRVRAGLTWLDRLDPPGTETAALASDVALVEQLSKRSGGGQRFERALRNLYLNAADTADALAARQRDIDREARSRSTWALLGGLVFAALLMWVFWSKRSAVEVKRRERRFGTLLQNSSDLVLVLDGDGRVRDSSPVAERLLGRSADGLAGQMFLDLVHREDWVPVAQALSTAGERPAGQPTGHWRAQHANGDWVDVDAVCLDQRDDPSVGGVVVTVRDVGEQRSLEKKLRHQAFHDSLTGLPNRALFEDRVRLAVARSLRHGNPPAVLFVDLDDFKTVNDSLGHAAGDELLRQVGERLDGCCRASDTAARLGGDEFAVLVEVADGGEDAAVVAARLHQALERPFEVFGTELFVHASVGIALADQGNDSDELLRNADIAMYAAKSGGKGRTEAYRATMHLEARKRLRLTSDLRRALINGELGVQYQPLVSLGDGRVLGVEALARWNHPEHGNIPPSDFIPLAEDSGLIVDIGRFVLGEACRQARSWADDNPDDTPVYVSVNLSARQFREPGLVVRHVREATEETGLDPTSLMLEITESVILDNRDAVIRELLALQELGARIAIDDFGTGYSALSYLRDFPIDTVKMDRSFVHDLARGAGDAALVRSVVELGEALDMEIVAEGIEHRHQLDSLSDLRCGVGQGYYFAKPLDAAEAAALLGAQSQQPAA